MLRFRGAGRYGRIFGRIVRRKHTAYVPHHGSIRRIFRNDIHVQAPARAVICRQVVLLTDAIVFIILAYRQLNLSGGVSASEKGIEVAGLLLLFASMVSALAASRAVKKDLRLVKSSGRLR